VDIIRGHHPTGVPACGQGVSARVPRRQRCCSRSPTHATARTAQESSDRHWDPNSSSGLRQRMARAASTRRQRVSLLGGTMQRSAATVVDIPELLRRESGTGLAPQQILDWHQQRERKQRSLDEVRAAEVRAADGAYKLNPIMHTCMPNHSAYRIYHINFV
jgi:hypothetical protein